MQSLLLRQIASAVGVVIAGSLGTAPARLAGPQAITIVGVDYAFQLPPHVTHGPTLITFENRGSVRHMLAIARLKDSVSIDSALHSMA